MHEGKEMQYILDARRGTQEHRPNAPFGGGLQLLHVQQALRTVAAALGGVRSLRSAARRGGGHDPQSRRPVSWLDVDVLRRHQPRPVRRRQWCDDEGPDRRGTVCRARRFLARPAPGLRLLSPGREGGGPRLRGELRPGRSQGPRKLRLSAPGRRASSLPPRPGRVDSERPVDPGGSGLGAAAIRPGFLPGPLRAYARRPAGGRDGERFRGLERGVDAGKERFSRGLPRQLLPRRHAAAVHRRHADQRSFTGWDRPATTRCRASDSTRRCRTSA